MPIMSHTSWVIMQAFKNHQVPDKILPCPNCKSTHIKKVHNMSARLPFWWYIECWDCHWCGKTKLFLGRAIKVWNKQRKRSEM